MVNKKETTEIRVTLMRKTENCQDMCEWSALVILRVRATGFSRNLRN
jgi:hypothetical protein